jgi:hypothetical protein
LAQPATAYHEATNEVGERRQWLLRPLPFGALQAPPKTARVFRRRSHFDSCCTEISFLCCTEISLLCRGCMNPRGVRVHLRQSSSTDKANPRPQRMLHSHLRFGLMNCIGSPVSASPQGSVLAYIGALLRWQFFNNCHKNCHSRQKHKRPTVSDQPLSLLL